MTKPRVEIKKETPLRNKQELRNGQKPTKVLNAAFVFRAKLLSRTQDHPKHRQSLISLIVTAVT